MHVRKRQVLNRSHTPQAVDRPRQPQDCKSLLSAGLVDGTATARKSAGIDDRNVLDVSKATCGMGVAVDVRNDTILRVMLSGMEPTDDFFDNSS